MTQFSERPRFDIGRVVERTFGVMGHNIGPFLLFTVLLSGLPIAAFQVLQYMVQTGQMTWQTSYWAPSLVGFVLYVLVTVMLQGAILRGAIDDLSGGKASVGEMFQTGVRLTPRLFAIGILFGLALIVGFILFIVPGIFLLIIWIAAAASAVGDNTGVFESFGRSARLTENHRWALLGVGLIFTVLGMIVGLIVGAVLVGVSMGMGVDVRLATAIANPIVTVFQTLVGTCGVAAVYVELRNVREGAGVQSLAKVFD